MGRGDECRRLDELIDAARAKESHALVLAGEPGVGKTALLDYAVQAAPDLRVERAAGVEPEQELPFGALHQLCGRMQEPLTQLPKSQREALDTALGRRVGSPPDRLLVGLAALGLLSEAAADQPLLCVVDDAQWLDQASLRTLSFVARRLDTEPICILFATRGPSMELERLPTLWLDGLDDRAAHCLLRSALRSPLVEHVHGRIIAEARGNPLALLELARGMTTMESAGGFGVSEPQAAGGGIEESLVRRLDALSEDARRLLLLAAAEPVGDPRLLARASERLGISVVAARGELDGLGLLTLGEGVTFRHPFRRSRIYRSAPLTERRSIHRALAEVTDRYADPDRRAWHLAAASAGPDETVASELERSAARAHKRGGIAASAAFLGRAAELTLDRTKHAGRALAAAEAAVQAGRFDAASRLLAAAETAPVNECQLARAELIRGRLDFASGLQGEAAALLLKAARRLKPFDPDLARQTYLTAWGAATVAPREARGQVLREISRAIRNLPRRPGAPRPLDLLLEGLALLVTSGRAAATPTLQHAAKLLTGIEVEDILRWGWMATAASNAVWDNAGAFAISERQVRLVRDSGVLAELPLHLSALGLARAWTGDLAGAASDMAEAESVATATGSAGLPWTVLRLRALQGREAEARAAIASAIEQAEAGALGLAAYAHWAAAVLNNGLARYEDAAASAREAITDFEYWVSGWVLPELIEANARLEDTEGARDALERLTEITQPVGNDAALGIEARCRALLSEEATAERLYKDAIRRLGRTGLRPELARSHLLFGEWLRRMNRRVDARAQLRVGLEHFTAMGMYGFAERARRELRATGETARKRSADTRDDLTPQERQIAELARGGLSNPEIGARLFLSRRTVEWHLRHVFAKLDIGSRRELAGALARSA